MRHWSGVLLFLICFYGLANTSNDSLTVRLDSTALVKKKIPSSYLEEFKNNPDFNYEEVSNTAPKWWIAFKNWIGNLFLKFFEWLFGVDKAVGAFSTFLELLPYLLLAVLVFILIKFFLNVNAKSIIQAQKNKTIVDLSEEENIIKNEDIQQLIKAAIADNNYRLAIRYYYLYMLQLMTEKEVIVWEQQKTNEDYRKEIQQNELIGPFATSTKLYNYFWYGKFPIDKATYAKAETTFLSLKKLLKNG